MKNTQNSIATDQKKVDEVLGRGPIDVIVKEELRERMLKGEKLRIKFGIDPTGPILHIGRASTISKIQDFIELGHQAVLIIGDFTGRVGDTSDKTDQRKSLQKEEVEANMVSYKEQIGKIIDISNVEFRYNSEWMEKLNFNDVIKLAKEFTVAQMIERENYLDRWQTHKPIGLHEFLYPLMQGYDSVAIKSDVELGGTDQLFNMMAGRRIQELFGMKPQAVITMPMLPGPDGRKMSTSWGNIITILDSPEDMYGKIMSVRDEYIILYMKLCTRIDTSKVEEYEKLLSENEVNPMDVKKTLAFEMTKKYHGEDKAKEASSQFKQRVQEKNFEDSLEIPLDEGEYKILDIITNITGLIPSRANAKRLIEQGAVSIDDQKVFDYSKEIDIKKGMIIKAGKRNAVKIV